MPSPKSDGRRRIPPTKNWVRAVGGLSGGVEGDMLSMLRGDPRHDIEETDVGWCKKEGEKLSGTETQHFSGASSPLLSMVDGVLR